MIFHLQIRLSITDQPQIYRTIFIPDSLTLDDLSKIIHICFGWESDNSGSFTATQSSSPAIRTADTPSNTPLFLYCLDNEAPFYFQPAGAASQNVTLDLQEFRIMRLKPELRLLDYNGNNTSSANGTHTLFSAEMVSQQLLTMQEAVLTKQRLSPVQMLDAFPDFKEDFLDTLRNRATIDDSVYVPENDIALRQLLQALTDDLKEITEVSQPLHTCLMQSTKDELLTIIRAHNISGYSKLKKIELVELLEEKLLDKDFLNQFFSALSYQELDILSQLYEQNIPFLSENSQTCAYLLNAGICYPTEDGFVLLPKEMRNALEECLDNADFQHDIQLFDVVHLYCQLDTYLYGIYPIAKLLQQIETVTGVVLTKDELLQLVHYRVTIDGRYAFNDGCIIHPLLEEDFIQQQNLLYFQHSNPALRKPNDAVLDQFYEEAWLVNEELYSLFTSTFFPYYRDEPESFDIFLHSMDLFMHTKISFDELVELLSNDFFQFPNKNIAKQFTSVLQRLLNDTVRWDLGGYTPNQKQKQKQSKTNKNNVISLQTHRQKKKK